VGVWFCQAVEKHPEGIILSEAKNLTWNVILNEVKDLMSSFALLRTGFVAFCSSEWHPKRVFQQTVKV
jgi:hypothetical protein